MRGHVGMDAEAGARAYLAWWALAGVDEAIDETPRGWGAQRAASPAKTTQIGYPGDIQRFHDWLARDPSLPEAGWGKRVLAGGQPATRLMVISDLPDAEDVGAATLFAGEAGRLFDNMLRAIGLDRSGIYLASLAIARPAGGLIPTDLMSVLARRMRHHIALVGPRRVLILGDTTSRALPTMSREGATGHLRTLNHDGGTVDAIATFHPRFLLGQPAAKAQAWAALRTLI